MVERLGVAIDGGETTARRRDGRGSASTATGRRLSARPAASRSRPAARVRRRRRPALLARGAGQLRLAAPAPCARPGRCPLLPADRLLGGGLLRLRRCRRRRPAARRRPAPAARRRRSPGRPAAAARRSARRRDPAPARVLARAPAAGAAGVREAGGAAVRQRRRSPRPRSRAARATRRRADASATRSRLGAGSSVSLRTSTAPPAVIAVAQTTAATLHAVAVAAPPASTAPPPPPPAAAAPPPAPPTPISFASSAAGPARRGRERRERAPHAAQRVPVLAAAVALAHVPARAARSLDAAIVGGHQVAPDLAAVGIARLLRLDEPDARAHQQRLDRRHGHVERAGELGVAQPVDLAHQQRRALLLGQAADVADEPPQVVAPLRLVDRVEQRLARHLEDLGRGRVRPPQVVDAAVVRDAVEPGAHVDRAAVAAQRPERAHEHVLQHVLGVLARVAARASGARRRTAAGGSGRAGRRTPRPSRRGRARRAARRSAAAGAGSRAEAGSVRAGACSADASTYSRLLDLAIRASGEP